MCRVVALPPFFPKEKAMEIMDNFCIGNDDGTGSVHIRDGRFVVNKWNFSFDKVVKRGLPLFDHMPHPGWTLAHVRAASHGKNTLNNTHPFIKRNVAMVHNGVFHSYAPLKVALSVTHKFKGQTDSEVAAVLWNLVGKDNFIRAVERGVFMFLNRNGQVDVVVKSGGDLVFQKTKFGVVMASELPHTYRRYSNVLEGYFKLGKNGEIIRSKWEKDPYSNWKDAACRSVAPKKQRWDLWEESTGKSSTCRWTSDSIFIK